jgi:N-acetylglucosamine-6-phosphate deacetylase
MVRVFLVRKKYFLFFSEINDICYLGIHIEGPFIDENKRGAHRTDFLRKSPHGIEDLLSCYGSFDNVSIVTIAPEIPNMIENVIPELVKKYGLVVSLGHSVASLDDGERAVCAGARFITHLFNAMLPFHHRDPGLVGKRKIII